MPVNTLRLKGKPERERCFDEELLASGSLISRCSPLSQIANEITSMVHVAKVEAAEESDTPGGRIPLCHFKNTRRVRCFLL